MDPLVSPSAAPASATPRHYKFWPKRAPRSITAPATSLWHNLAISALRYPDKVATVFFGSTITYAQLVQQAERLAACLHGLGVRAGDRVVLSMQNCPQLVVAHWAILRANAVVVPVNPMNRAEELKHYITDPDARVAITTADLAGEMAQASNALEAKDRLAHLVVTHFTDAFDPAVSAPNAPPPAWMPWLTTPHDLPELVGGQVLPWADALANSDAAPAHTAGPQDLAVLPYTSGTTGLPKGCMHPHATLMHQVVAAGVLGGGSAETVALAVVPMFHATGMISVMHSCVYQGATMVMMPRWDRDLAGRLISTWRVTHWANIPTMVIDLLASPNSASFDLRSLKYVSGGGAAMPQAVAERLQAEFDLVFAEGYGLTETAAPTHANLPERAKLQCLGIPIFDTDSRIIDPDTGRELGIGETGEIVSHGPQVFKGYWGHPEATQASFIEIDGKPFFRTGDLGRMDEEGFFFITDRLKRMINASGFKVWPSEVELLLFKCPLVQEACVIASRDAYRGETVKAVVVLREAARGQTEAEDIIAWAREHMAAYKVPRIVEFAQSLPKSGSGKVMWRLLQEKEPAAG